MEPGRKKLLKTYSENHFDALVSDDKLAIYEFLEEMKKLIADGSIPMKEDKKGKTVSKVDEMAATKVLDKLSAEFMENQRKVGEIDNKVAANQLLHELKGLKKKADGSLKKVEDAGARLNATAESAGKAAREAESLRVEMESGIAAAAGIKIKITG